ncbi:hypothetical protein HH643_004936 [Escherichia coli]|nr:hypothetical protein [Escherichia coli]
MGKYWRDEIADSFTKTGVRLHFTTSTGGGCLQSDVSGLWFLVFPGKWL